MPSKSKNVRIEQRRILEKKLDLRLQKLAQKGISKDKALNDPLVKNLKAKIRETNIRIETADKFVRRAQELVQAKAQKLAEPAKKKEKSEPGAAPVGPKPKKHEKESAEAKPKPKQHKEAPATNEPVKETAKEPVPAPVKEAAKETGAAEPEAKPKPKKKATPAPKEASATDTEPKKRAPRKKKEEAEEPPKE